MLRRPVQANEVILRVGPLELDRIERMVKRGSRKIELQPRQFRLLEYMMVRIRRAVDGGHAICNLVGVLCSGVRIAGWPRPRPTFFGCH
jgi:DNA-binding response OmpR family regulator